MKLVILTQYFPPEVGAPQNRLYELAVRLKNHGVEVTVLTAMPNYPSMEVHDGYKGKWYANETIEGIRVYRAWIFVSKSKSVVKRLMNYLSFVFTSFIVGFFKLPKHDFLLVESPPLFLGQTAFLLSRLRGSKMIFNVSDLWPESAEKLGIISNKKIIKAATALEEFLYRRAFLITGQTQGICANIQSRFPNKNVFWVPNGVDIAYYNADEITSDFRKRNGFDSDQFIVLYAGIIGHAQGLEVILNAAELLKQHTRIQFVLVGSGPMKLELMEYKQTKQLQNVHFYDAVEKSKMPDIVAGADIAVIPLKKLDLFLGAIPSKIFESLAMRKPILLGVEGEAKSLFIDQAKAGVAFEPENHQALSEAVLYMSHNPSICKEMGENGLSFVSRHFTRDLIAEKLLMKLKNIH